MSDAGASSDADNHRFDDMGAARSLYIENSLMGNGSVDSADCMDIPIETVWFFFSVLKLILLLSTVEESLI